MIIISLMSQLQNAFSLLWSCFCVSIDADFSTFPVISNLIFTYQNIL